MAKILNENYKKFLNEGVITTLSEQDINKAMDNVTGRYAREGKALIATLYYTGGRPIEVLDIIGTDIKKEGQYIVIKLRGAKGGLPRPIYLSVRKPFVNDIYDFSRSLFLERYIFYHFRGCRKHNITNKKGDTKEYIEITDKLVFHFKKWFDNVIEGGISPYYLRHNRFSKLAERGATTEQIRLIKGAKTLASVTPYVHLSTSGAKKISKINE